MTRSMEPVVSSVSNGQAIDCPLEGLEGWSRVVESLQRPGGTVAVRGVLGRAVPCVVAGAAKGVELPAVLVVSTVEEARELAEDLAEWCRCWGVRREVLVYAPPDEMERGLPVVSSDAVEERMVVLRKLRGLDHRWIVVTTPEAEQSHLPGAAWWGEAGWMSRRGGTFSYSEFQSWVARSGYRRTSLVEGPGEWAQRGGLIDVFSWGTRSPYRLELDGDDIVSIRQFDPVTQLSVGEAEEALCLPSLSQEGTAGLSAYLPTRVWMTTFEVEPWSSTPTTWSMLHLFISPSSEVNPQSSIRNPQFLWSMQPTDHLRGYLPAVEKSVEQWKAEGWRVWWTCRNAGERDRLMELMGEKGWWEGARFSTPLLGVSTGCIWPSLKWVVLPDHELFARYRTRPPKAAFRGHPLTNLMELKPSDFVVHREYGIARYLGASRFKVDHALRDFLTLEYEGGDKLHIPFERFSVVQKYIGTGHQPSLHALGSSGWERAKAKVKEQTRKMAEALLKLYAARQAIPGIAFGRDTEWQQEFEAAFPYQETRDQRESTDRIKAEMERPVAMDHLLCGDVGYGKTEVAMRAAFKAAMAKKQVAVFAPTTVLVEQHCDTFRERMADYPLRIAMLSRFQKPAEQKKVVEAAARGEVDILIGTHRLLSKDVAFADLGLVIIDEEQRLGVAHKERLKELSRQVDVLTLTATPIPRTLQFALSGLRSLSVIDTPPEGRLPVMTYVLVYDETVVAEAIRRELSRGGQVFFVHNRIDQLGVIGERLKTLVPEVRAVIVHGQLPPARLEQGMRSFVRGSANVLLTTTIIEAGLDLGNVNTLIVNRADRFGLAEMYQLRGRVGRGRRQAYAYFCYDGQAPMTPVARERLQAIAACQGLGGGFRIAMKDLELRGAGNLLGPEQHGQVAAVGFELYCQLLAEAVAELKGQPVEREDPPELHFPVDAYLPDEYAGDDQQKLRMYQQLVNAKVPEDLHRLRAEWKDRCGVLPEPVERLVALAEVKVWAVLRGVVDVRQGEGGEVVIRHRGGREWVLKSVASWTDTIQSVKDFLAKLAP